MQILWLLSQFKYEFPSKNRGKMDIKNIVKEFLINELKDNGFSENVLDDESLIDAGIIDSLGFLLLISFLGEKFGIIIDKDELNPENFDSVHAICKFIESKFAKKLDQDLIK